MAITRDTPTFGNTGTEPYTVAHTISENARIVVFLTWEIASVISSVQFGGVSMTQIGSKVTQGNQEMVAFYLDSSLSAASHNLTWSLTVSRTVQYYIESMTGAATGAPEASMTDTEASGGGTVVGDGADITVTDGAAILSVTAGTSGSTNTSSVTTVTETQNNTGGPGYRCAAGVLASATAGTVSVDWTYGGTSSDRVVVTVSNAEAAGAATDPPPERGTRGRQRGMTRGNAA